MEKKKSGFTTKKLVYCAMCIALSAVTAWLVIWRFPFSGSITLFSMLFIILPAWMFGTGTGIICGLILGVLQFMFNPYYYTFLQFLFDYILAFSIMGLAGIFRNSKNGLLKGYCLGVVGRWLMASIAGLILVSLGSTPWDGWAPLPYSMAYNASYIFAEAIMTIIVISIPAVKNALEKIKSQL